MTANELVRDTRIALRHQERTKKANAMSAVVIIIATLIGIFAIALAIAPHVK